MEIGKKGAFFTLTALVMVSILFFVIQTNYTNQMQRESFVINNRVKSVDYFVSDLERDIRRGMYIATYRGLLGLQQQMASKGEFINNTDSALQEIIVNGSYNGNYLSVMNNSELNTWFEKIRQQSSKMSINVEHMVNNISVYHTSPWDIKIEMNVSLNISDTQGVCYWNREKILKANLSIVDFEDPLYNMKTHGQVVNVIKPTNITDFVDGENTSGLIKHIENDYYFPSNSSPSYLMRISGNLNGSEYGIESIVDLRELDDVGIPLKDKSSIDYIYFSEDDPNSWKINNTFNWLRIDNESRHLSNYQVENLTVY